MISIKRVKKQTGITLIALVITIVILIILAAVAINAAFGDNGLIQQAEKAREYQLNADSADSTLLNSATEYIEGIIDGNGNSGGSGETPTIPSTVEEAKESEFVFTEKTTIEDEHGNKITIPGGFKIPEDSGDTVQEGIVIEDISASTDENVQGSQFVWIPVGKFIKDDGSESNEIILGRYTFNTTDGTSTLIQNATNYTEDVKIDSLYTEFPTYQEGIISDESDGKNSTAKDLKGFIDSVNANGGYYIGRYEASYASGNGVENYKAASKITTEYSTDNMSYKASTLWNYITQIDASQVSINTYLDSTTVKSDLMNSYAWDTAIVYIQEAGNNNYANRAGNSISSNLANTGTIGDEVCKINDMSSNVWEWTTENSSYNANNSLYPCIGRGGNFYSNGFTARRGSNLSSTKGNNVGFRFYIYM